MRTSRGALRFSLAMGAMFLHFAGATVIPRLSFEELTDASELIVSGRIAASWTSWDQQHKYIWTHYSLGVASLLKGSAGGMVEFAEPGGARDGQAMSIAGSVSYAVGESMVVFLSRMPNGYLRTTGWAQGRYALDAQGRLQPQTSALQVLRGMSLAELRRRVSERSRAQLGGIP